MEAKRKPLRVTRSETPPVAKPKKAPSIHALDQGEFEADQTYLVSLTGRELNWGIWAAEAQQRNIATRHKANARKAREMLADLREKQARLEAQGKPLSARDQLRLERSEECPLYGFEPVVLGIKP